MATNRAVVASLAMLGRAFAGVVDEERVELYRAALEDLTDEQLATATALVVKSHTGEFIPPPAVVRKAIAPAATTIDAVGILRRIEKLAVYNPNVGMVYPRVDVVREQLGDATAYAYAAAGGPRVFSDNEVSRDIATREFQKALSDAANRPHADLPILGAPTTPRALPPGASHV
ncbi:MAG TPA: hypothetical protein VK636_14740 [Gemmatimonadaceae bacterium]|nr:hypothetical protein [Gemmatimonadaceae bacterium]